MHALILLVLTLFSFVPAAAAAPTVACHCFQDRTFDPQRPTAADDYFLAAAQNSLYAEVAGVDKKAVVRAKMGGADGAELWVSWYLAQAGDLPAAGVESLRAQGVGWRRVAEQLRLPLDRLAPAVAQGVLRDAATPLLAGRVVDAVLVRECRQDAAAVQRLRSAGAGDRETILALVLAQQTGGAALEIFHRASIGAASWSAQAAQAGIDATTLEARARRLVRR